MQFWWYCVLQEHDDIPEVLVDLQYSLAKSYSSTPELRETWLEHMAAVHESHENYSEVSSAYVTWTLRACRFAWRVHGLRYFACAFYHPENSQN